MNKKGFTLVELLAVIAILAILVIIALPNVLGMFRQAKQNSFQEEAQKLYQTATTEYINGALGTTISDCFSGTEGEKNLDLTGRHLDYLVRFTDGKITTFKVTDGTYKVDLPAAEASGEIKVTDIKAATGGIDVATLKCAAE